MRQATIHRKTQRGSSITESVSHDLVLSRMEALFKRRIEARAVIIDREGFEYTCGRVWKDSGKWNWFAEVTQ